MTSSQALIAAYKPLIDAIQHNCRIADAFNAQENPMCVYLMKMRDYFRWSHNLPIHACVPKDQLGKWINQQERLWEQLIEENFIDLPIDDQRISPFDIDTINQRLAEHGLCYSAGFGRGGQAHFHLGQKESHEAIEDPAVQISGIEYARDLTAPPAHTINGVIFLRKDALKRYVWGKIEEWRWKKPDNAMGRVIAFYDFDENPDNSLGQITQRELVAVHLHEQGEQQAGEMLGPDWENILIELQGSREEILCRASRDHLADCLVTLPSLFESENLASIHFYFANLEGFRKIIWKELLDRYKVFVDNSSLEELAQFVEQHGLPLWRSTCNEILHHFQLQGVEGVHNFLGRRFTS